MSDKILDAKKAVAMSQARCRYKQACSLFFLTVFVIIGFGAASGSAQTAPEAERRINDLLAKMTLQEKVGQLQQLDGDANTGRGKDEHRDLIRRGVVGSFLNVRGARNVNEVQHMAVDQSRLKIPLLLGFDVIHGYRTIFPIPLGEASSWDPAAVERAARVAAVEASAAGLKWTFAPMVDIARDPRWGRISEGSGEDPYLGSAMARARCTGFKAKTRLHRIGSWPVSNTGSPTARRKEGGTITPWTCRNRPCEPSTFRRFGPPSRREQGP